ncbi:MAG: cation:proton antiporter [Bacillales bacterium]|nr:cation:proton antiporter [Bacillales bacterium]
MDLFIIFLGGALILFLLSKIKVPSLIGYLLIGILIKNIGLLDPTLEAISPMLRKIALLIILIKAGLSLNISDLKKVGRPAIMMSFLPAVIEMVTIGLIGPLIFPITHVESFLLGSIVGAVSPAVVIPMMSKLIEQKYGTKKCIPQLVLAGSSIDDIVMIVFYQTFLNIESGGNINALSFLNVFISIVLGILIGVGLGFLFHFIFKKIKIRNTLKLLIFIALGIGLTCFENYVSKYVGFSSLLATIMMCLIYRYKNIEIANKLTLKASKIWIPTEMILFFLVGASIKIEYATKFILPSLLLLLISLIARSIMVRLCIIKTDLNFKEKIFVIVSYLPKATVQASIGGGLLDLGNKLLNEGNGNAEAIIASGIIVLSVSVLSILITAPLSSLFMNLTYDKLLEKEQ